MIVIHLITPLTDIIIYPAATLKQFFLSFFKTGAPVWRVCCELLLPECAGKISGRRKDFSVKMALEKQKN
ncbi:hypothetical protein PTH_2054 [Pelotomaculum thermopropionicum SI]|uniref:Uncharacterized protein n=1 Tax=Pelotomaculum thermopropionicum (strain DSM 13744 / JCM 10971 / SI) TaxID=370438 RepID=A5D0J4_PELTS|nr:hypothetical protein PTH_2054 [Pelotomaculum thermopropionicum SI]